MCNYGLLKSFLKGSTQIKLRVQYNIWKKNIISTVDVFCNKKCQYKNLNKPLLQYAQLRYVVQSQNFESCGRQIWAKIKKDIFQAQSNLPVEKCELKPLKECRDVSILVPSLQAVEKCMDVPKEVCSKVEQPRLVSRTKTRLFCDSSLIPTLPQGIEKIG